jgi:hypothetical protein
MYIKLHHKGNRTVRNYFYTYSQQTIKLKWSMYYYSTRLIVDCRRWFVIHFPNMDFHEVPDSIVQIVQYLRFKIRIGIDA